MDGSSLQNLVTKGCGVAARRIGTPYVVYRPKGYTDPLASKNRIIKLYAKLIPAKGIAVGTPGYSGVLWQGIFDSLYTQAGDYLKGADATFFVASQLPDFKIVCLRAETNVTVQRITNASINTYSGFNANAASDIIKNWPAHLTLASGRNSGSLPEAHFGNWYAFLPAMPYVPQVADILTDDLDRRFIISGAQLSGLGWRLSMRQVDG